MTSMGNFNRYQLALDRGSFVGGATALMLSDLAACTNQSLVGANGLPVSIVSLGNLGRLQSVLRRAKAGYPINIGFLGGSITAGAVASTPAKRWSSLIVSQFNALFGNVATEINCGIGRTNSDYGALRVDRDVINRNLNVLYLEYAVNNGLPQRPSYESIIRRVEIACPGVAIIPVMMCNNV